MLTLATIDYNFRMLATLPRDQGSCLSAISAIETSLLCGQFHNLDIAWTVSTHKKYSSIWPILQTTKLQAIMQAY